MPSASPAFARLPVHESVRVLRWAYRRDDEVITCELGLNADLSAYELLVRPACYPATSGSEVFDDAVSAFQRQGRIEGWLIDDGWHLERFETVVR